MFLHPLTVVVSGTLCFSAADPGTPLEAPHQTGPAATTTTPPSTPQIEEPEEPEEPPTTDDAPEPRWRPPAPRRAEPTHAPGARGLPPPRRSTENLDSSSDDAARGTEESPAETARKVRFGMLQVFVSHGDFGGTDFDGTHFLASNDGRVALIPKLHGDESFGAGVQFGVMRPGHAGFFAGLNVIRTWTSASFAGIELGDAGLTLVELPLRVAFAASSRVGAYLEGGGGFAWLSVPNAVGHVTPEGDVSGIEELSLSGVTLSAAAGIWIHATDHLGVDLSVGGGTIMIGDVEDEPIGENLSSGYYRFRFGPALLF